MTIPQKLPLTQRIAYGIGGFPSALLHNSLYALANPIFVIVLGVRPDLIGLAFLLSRIWDAMTDPLVGYWSDKFNSRWGRRRPFIVVGSFLAGVTFIAIWLVPTDSSSSQAFTWFLIALLFYLTSATLFQIPYDGLGFELTHDYHERTRLQAFRAFFSKIGGFLGWWLYPLALLPVFGGALAGARWVAILVAILLAGSGLVVGWFIRDAPVRSAVIPTGFWSTARGTLRNRPFLILIMMSLLFTIGLFSTLGLSLFIAIYHVAAGDQSQGSSLNSMYPTAVLLTGTFLIPLLTWASTRLGKARALIISLTFLVLGSVLSWWLYNPSFPWMVVVFGVVVAPGHAAFFMLIQSMLADVADWDELHSGQRKEASYAAVSGWFIKLGIGFSQWITGLLLVWVGFDASLNADQAPGVIDRMRAIYALIPAGFTLGAMVCMYYYPLSAAKMAEVRAALQARSERSTRH